MFTGEGLGKQLFIAEKPSVAQEFARTLGLTGGKHDGYLENDGYIVTWCFGHLVSMSYPEVYDAKLKKWSLETLPFLPEQFRYEIIPSSAKQFRIVSSLLARSDVERIYVCTDSGREGEYIYRLVEMMSDPVVKTKDRRRVWIDSFTEAEIQRGIREAKDISEYDHLSDSAYLRAQEDYLMGINFSRVLTLKYGSGIADYRNAGWSAVAVGRVMTCVLGMVVRREREIRVFVKQPFYRIVGTFSGIEAEWRVVPGSAAEGSSGLYKENGFRERKDAEKLVWSILRKARGAEESEETKADHAESLAALKDSRIPAVTESVTRKTEKKNAPLIYNLAELQNECSRLFHISPDQTLKIAQELYEKKLTTYPRTDARVLSTAVAKEIDTNLRGLVQVESVGRYAAEILSGDAWKKIGKTRYTNDKAITDHYAIIPTGSGLKSIPSLSELSRKVYETICRRFLSIFYPPAVYEKMAAVIKCGGESFFANTRELKDEGYLKVLGHGKNAAAAGDGGIGLSGKEKAAGGGPELEAEGNVILDDAQLHTLKTLKKDAPLMADRFSIKEGETAPPKRYTSGSMILAMENAGQLIEDEGLREQIRGSGIGTSATRADILAKLVKIGYLALNSKTQIITPELLGEMVYDVVDQSIRPLLSAELTASWEKGLTQVADGSITAKEYLDKLEGFVARRTNAVKGIGEEWKMRPLYDEAAKFYSSKKGSAKRVQAGQKAAAGKRTGFKASGTGGKRAGSRSKKNEN